MSLSHESARLSTQSFPNEVDETLLDGSLEVPETLNPKLLKENDIWRPEYGRYSHEITYQRLEEVKNRLQQAGSWDQQAEEDFVASVRFVDNVFEMYHQGHESIRHERSFAFVVPNRMERGREEYSTEIVPLLPVAKRLGSCTSQLIFSELPPFIVDEYGEGTSEGIGYMVYAPVMTDMIRDHPSPRKKFQEAMDHTVEFAEDKLGVDTVGLGAILPKLTNYGESLKENHPEITVTTGHAATVWLIGETLKKAINENYIESPDKIGIVGAGAIGRATMHYLIKGLEYKPQGIYITDQLHNKSKKVAGEIQDVNVTRTNAELLDNVDVVISAVTRPIDLEDIYPDKDLKGKLIIDDSQPGSFDKKQVTSRNGILAWVIGKDNSPDRALTGKYFDYGGLGPAHFDQIWGCQAESLVSYLYPELALHGREVELLDVMEVGKRLRDIGVDAAPLQSHGQEY